MQELNLSGQWNVLIWFDNLSKIYLPTRMQELKLSGQCNVLIWFDNLSKIYLSRMPELNLSELPSLRHRRNFQLRKVRFIFRKKIGFEVLMRNIKNVNKIFKYINFFFSSVISLKPVFKPVSFVNPYTSSQVSCLYNVHCTSLYRERIHCMYIVRTSYKT